LYRARLFERVVPTELARVVAGRPLAISVVTLGEASYGALSRKWSPRRTAEMLGFYTDRFGVVDLGRAWRSSRASAGGDRGAWPAGRQQRLVDRRVCDGQVETTRLESTRGPSGPVWTGASARTILRCMTTPDQRCPTCGGLLAADKRSLLAPDERLTPWMIHDLPRIAWIVEYRAAELTDEERQIVHDATTRMLHALEPDTV
jgi:hypothetical protein